MTWQAASDAQAMASMTKRGALIRTRADGIIGFVPASLAFAALDPAGFVVATNRDGVSVRASLAKAAQESAYQVVAPGLRILDIARKHQVALRGAVLVRSTNAGKSWQNLSLSGASDAKVRYDGVIVARVADGFATVDANGAVAPVVLDRPPGALLLRRVGAWLLLEADPRPLRRSVLTLAADGHTWIETRLPRGIADAGHHQWEREWQPSNAALDSERWLGEAPQRALTAAAPAAPEPEPEVMTIGGGPMCQGVACCGWDRLPDIGGELEARFTDDALALADGSRSGPFKRPASIVVIDRKNDTTRFVRTPAECAPLDLSAARGLVVLECKQQMFELDGDRWVEVVRHAHEPKQTFDFMMSDDGMLLAVCDGRVAWLRNPEPPGSRAAWRELTTPTSIWFHLLPDGQVLSVVNPQGEHLELHQLDPRGASIVDTLLASYDVPRQLARIEWQQNRWVLHMVGGDAIGFQR